MASNVRIHNPYILATLPRPLDQTHGRLLARPVFGINKGGVKRQRSEVAVGIDGEAVSASRLVTSYPIPPHDSFVCPPCSLRIRYGRKESVARYTYVATSDPAGTKITLFKDSLDEAGKWVSTSSHRKLNRTASVVQLDTVISGSENSAGWLVAVRDNGDIVCLDGDNLSEVWVESSRKFLRDVMVDFFDDDEYGVNFATQVIRRKDREKFFLDLLHTAPPNPHQSNPDSILLVMVATATTTTTGRDVSTRYVMILALNPNTFTSIIGSSGPNISPLQIAPLPIQEARRAMGQPTYEFHEPSGNLMALHHDRVLDIINLSSSPPKLYRTIHASDAFALLPLSSQSVLSCSLNSAAIHNYVFRSIQAQASFALSDLDPVFTETTEAKELEGSCSAVGYFRTLDLAVVLLGNSLVSIPIEASKSRGMKRQIDGRLIDAIGRGETQDREADANLSLSTSVNHIGSDSGDGPISFHEKRQRADSLLANGLMWEFETLMATRFGVHTVTTSQDTDDSPEWSWPQSPAEYTPVDRQWILYTISRALSFHSGPATNDSTPIKLVPALPTANILIYLVVAGHLTIANLRIALSKDVADADINDGQLAEELIRVLKQADPTLDLLMKFIFATRLGAPELVVAIRELMRSLELLQDTAEKPTNAALTLEAHSSKSADAEEEEMELDKLEDELALTEFHLDDDSGVRTRGLTTALAKLACCPVFAAVHSMRTILQPNEILSLVNLLRVELVKGAWTSRYTDMTSFETGEMEPPPDNSVALIATLLSRCLDSIGPKAWFLNDAVTVEDHPETGDFFAALKLVVKAALEGLEEAVYLNGIVTEAVRFGSRAGANNDGVSTTGGSTSDKPTTVHMDSRESHYLPLGFKRSQSMQSQKVVSGGEVVQRSKREMGHIKSKKVGAYSLEKLAV